MSEARKTYRCDNCGGVFDRDAEAEQKAIAEAKELHGVEDAHTRSDMAIVCDDCFQKMKAHFGW